MLTNSGYVGGLSAANDNPANSPLYTSLDSCFRVVGTGLGSSTIERDTIVFPTVTGLNPSSFYRLKFKLATIGITPSVNTAAGVDNPDYVQLESAINGAAYIGQIKVTGSSNSVWGFGATGNVPWSGVLTKTAGPALSIYGASSAFPYSTVNLDFSTGVTQLAIRIIMAVNASGETWLIDDVELIELTRLPVELLEFGGTYYNTGVKLYWSTASETNNDHFEILKSFDGFNFTKIASIKGRGNSNTVVEYEYIDYDVCDTIVYYKLRQVDYDGVSEEFYIIAFQCRHPYLYDDFFDVLGRKTKQDYDGIKIYNK